MQTQFLMSVKQASHWQSYLSSFPKLSMSFTLHIFICQALKSVSI